MKATPAANVHSKLCLAWRMLIPILLLAIWPDAPVQAASHITSPKEFFSANIGDDYFLANYQQLTNYWFKLAHESSRLKVAPMGLTEEGRIQYMGILSSPANLHRLAKYQETSRRLALVEGVSDSLAHKLAREGKAVVWIDGGLHANEVLGAQQLIETMYQLIASNDEETERILDNVIILFVHANPDGMDLCSNWYMRETDPKKRTLNDLPRLYQKYIGHDNNRDFYAATQAETRNMNRVMYHDWLPQVVYNHHQAGPPGTVLFAPPFRDPFNYNVDPLVISGIDALGASMMQRFLVEDKPGATVRSGTRYSTWWNGGLRTTCYFHNMIGLLTETIGSPTPIEIPYNAALQLPKADYPYPIAPQTWHFRQSIDYSVSANKSVLDYASRHREQLLYNIWHMGTNAITKGNSDTWTTTPKIVESARKTRTNSTNTNTNPPATTSNAVAQAEESAAASRRPNRGGRMGNPEQFNQFFHDPLRRNPRGYIIPSNQPDFLTAVKFVNALMDVGVRVEQATADFSAGGISYPAGSFVLHCAQPFRAHVLDMFEPQDHPDDFPYPGASPTPPYDIAGWTLAYQMGVRFDRELEQFSGPFVALEGPAAPPAAKVEASSNTVGYFFDTRENDSYRAVNRLLAAGQEVRRLQEPFTTMNSEFAPGTFFVPRKANTLPLLQRTGFELGVKFTAISLAPGKQAGVLKPVRIALWDRYGGSIPSGWTRWLLERFEFPFQVVYAPELNRGGLREKYDVILFVDGAIPPFQEGAAVRRNAEGGDQPPREKTDGATQAETNLPAEYRDRRGNISVTRTLPILLNFLESGGTIVTIGGSTSLGYHLGLAMTNQLMELDDKGKPRSLPREKFYIPGSLLQVKVDTTNPLAWGMRETTDVMYTAESPVFRLLDGAEAGGLNRIAWYETKTPLRSGWAWGQDHLENGVAIIDAKIGSGKLVMFGPEILFRAQPHGTFKFLFNAIERAGTEELKDIQE